MPLYPAYGRWVALCSPDPPLTDGVVLLRSWAASDLPLLERASHDGYVAMIEHLPTPLSAAEGYEWIAAQQAFHDAERGWALAIEEVGPAEGVGGVGIALRHPPGTAELGVWVLEERRNRGFARRAALLLCRWALTSGTGIARLQATVEPWNTPSRRALETVGFVREGLLRAYASWGGARQDVLLYSLLPGDLEAQPDEDARSPGALTAPAATRPPRRR